MKKLFLQILLLMACATGHAQLYYEDVKNNIKNLQDIHAQLGEFISNVEKFFNECQQTDAGAFLQAAKTYFEDNIAKNEELRKWLEPPITWTTYRLYCIKHPQEGTAYSLDEDKKKLLEYFQSIALIKNVQYNEAHDTGEYHIHLTVDNLTDKNKTALMSSILSVPNTNDSNIHDSNIQEALQRDELGIFAPPQESKKDEYEAFKKKLDAFSSPLGEEILIQRGITKETIQKYSLYHVREISWDAIIERLPKTFQNRYTELMKAPKRSKKKSSTCC